MRDRSPERSLRRIKCPLPMQLLCSYPTVKVDAGRTCSGRAQATLPDVSHSTGSLPGNTNYSPGTTLITAHGSIPHSLKPTRISEVLLLSARVLETKSRYPSEFPSELIRSIRVFTVCFRQSCTGAWGPLNIFLQSNSVCVFVSYSFLTKRGPHMARIIAVVLLFACCL